MAICKRMRMISVCASLCWLTACSTSSRVDDAMMGQGLTVSQLYHKSVADSAKSWTQPRYRIKPTEVSNAGYAGSLRAQERDDRASFRTLENPSIPMYVYPHIALIGDEQLIKPGFTTEFFLYRQNQFALAAERY